MIILGDIGNTKTKICLVNNNLRIIKKFLISSKIQKINKLDNYLKKINFSIKELTISSLTNLPSLISSTIFFPISEFF